MGLSPTTVEVKISFIHIKDNTNTDTFTIILAIGFIQNQIVLLFCSNVCN